MINWRTEEEMFIDKKIREYRKNLSTWELIFMNEKRLNKEIEYIRSQAKTEFRSRKLDEFVDIVENERKRIDKVVESLNDKFSDYLDSQKALISKKIKPIKMIARDYRSNDISDITPYETVEVYIEPIRVAFLQEKISDKEEEYDK